MLGCGGVRWPDRWLSTDTLCRQAREWSAVTVQECPSLALSLWVDMKQLSESPLRCLPSVRIPDDVGYNPRQKVREEFNHRSPFSRTQVLAALGGGEEGRRREWSQTQLFQADRNGGESDGCFRRRNLELSWGKGKTQG